MSALIILASILVGLNVAGILGALVAIPVAGCVMVVLREFIGSRNSRKENGEKPEEADGYVSIVFLKKDRKFVKPHIPRKPKKSAKN